MRLISRPTTVSSKLPNGHPSLARAVYGVKDEVINKAPAQLQGDHVPNPGEAPPPLRGEPRRRSRSGEQGLILHGQGRQGERMEIAEIDTEVHPFLSACSSILSSKAAPTARRRHSSPLLRQPSRQEMRRQARVHRSRTKRMHDHVVSAMRVSSFRSMRQPRARISARARTTSRGLTRSRPKFYLHVRTHFENSLLLSDLILIRVLAV